MKIPRHFAITISVIPMLVVGIALTITTVNAFAENGAGIANSETRSPAAVGGTASIVEKPLPGGPIGKPLPPIPVDPGKGDGRIGHDSGSDRKHGGRDRYYERRHKHSRYESPPIIGKDPKRASRRSDLFRRGVVGPAPGN